jgi:hypothetical protein
MKPGARARDELLVGWASEDITPVGPVELCGQYYQRLSTRVRDPLHATACALQRGPRAASVLLALDVVAVGADFVSELRARVRPEVPDLDPDALSVSAIHTHNAPQVKAFINWWRPDPAALPPERYRALLLDRATRAVVRAWRGRRPGSAGSLLAHAVTGHCRRAMYADGSSEMYGRTDRPDFIGMESGEDAGVEMIFFRDRRRRPTGVILNVACPAQVMEARYCVTADFIGDLRREVRRRVGKDFTALPLVAPSGDQSPRDLTRNCRGEPDMWDAAGAAEIGRRLADAVEAAQTRVEMEPRPVFARAVERLRLPLRRVSRPEYRHAAALFNDLQAREPKDPRSPRAAFNRFVAEVRAAEARGGPGPYDGKLHDFVLLRNNEAVLQRYRHQAAHPGVTMELHTLRLGDALLATNPFELYIDFGRRIRARSPARRTLLAQLCNDSLGYLPTAHATARGGYGSLVINGCVGPEGGDLLVEATLRAIDRLWRR